MSSQRSKPAPDIGGFLKAVLEVGMTLEQEKTIAEREELVFIGVGRHADNEMFSSGGCKLYPVALIEGVLRMIRPDGRLLKYNATVTAFYPGVDQSTIDNLVASKEVLEPQLPSLPAVVLSKDEKDPNGVAQHAAGAKLDYGKPRCALVLGGFARALMEVAKVGTYGAVKYTDNGWMEVENGTDRYDDAGLRHWLQEKIGEDCDIDTELLHAAHYAWNGLARLDLLCRLAEDRKKLLEGGEPK